MGGALPQSLEHEITWTRFRDHRPLSTALLGDESSLGEMAEARKGMSNWKTVWPDGHPAALLTTGQP